MKHYLINIYCVVQEQLGLTGTHVDRAQNKRKSRAIEPLREKIFDVS